MAKGISHGKFTYSEQNPWTEKSATCEIEMMPLCAVGCPAAFAIWLGQILAGTALPRKSRLWSFA